MLFSYLGGLTQRGQAVLSDWLAEGGEMWPDWLAVKTPRRRCCRTTRDLRYCPAFQCRTIHFTPLTEASSNLCREKKMWDTLWIQLETVFFKYFLGKIHRNWNPHSMKCQ